MDIKRLADETHGFDIHLTEQYRQQDLRCRFQACTLSARVPFCLILPIVPFCRVRKSRKFQIMLINEHCNQNGIGEDQREHARRTVRRYYEDDLELDLIEYGETLNATRRFPRFCAAFLAQQKVGLTLATKRCRDKMIQRVQIYLLLVFLVYNFVASIVVSLILFCRNKLETTLSRVPFCR